MKFDPPKLTIGPLSNLVYVVTHGKEEPHPTIKGQTMITATVKYDITDQFFGVAEEMHKRRTQGRLT